MFRAVRAEIEKFVISLDVSAFIAFNFLRGVIADQQIKNSRWSRLEKWADDVDAAWSLNMVRQTRYPFPAIEASNAYGAGIQFLN